MAIGYLNYRHGGSSSPIYGLAQSVLRGEIGAPKATMPAQISSATAKSSRYATVSNPFPVAHVLRDQRRRDLLAAIEEWRRASGPERVWWRGNALHRLAEWRTLYQRPERAAFQAAVARSQGARP